MLDHLIFMGALNASEIGDAFATYLARQIVGAVAEEAKKRATDSVSGISDVASGILAIVGHAAGIAAKEAGSDNVAGIQERIKSIVSDGFKEFNLVVMSASDAQLLQNIVDVAAGDGGNGDLQKALSAWNSRSAKHST